jgi:hypothetical protein
MYNKLKSFAGRIKINHVIIIWVIVNLISAAFTPIYSDETYYTLFSQKLAFGYFDHPPMIALFIRLGSFLAHNELSKRLLSVFSIAFALYLTFKLAAVNRPLLFMAAIFSVFDLNLYGFMALPDAPLLLFTVLFFVAYKRFLHKETLVNAILLGLVMAALMYSKYHGILVIIFTLVSNIKLLKSGKFWLAGLLGLLLFTPHLLWQYNNSFITFSYHLYERSASFYKVSYTIEYIYSQILLYGPITAIFMYIALFRYRVADKFDRALVWNIFGIIGFFFLSSFKGRVEGNWTFPALVALLIIFLKYTNTNPLLGRRFYFFAIPFMILILLFRIQMFYPLFNIRISRIEDMRNQKEFANEVLSKSQGLPIVAGSYQKAGIMSFYSGTFVPSLNLNGRSNQFDLWHVDDSLRYKKVAYLNDYLNEGADIQNPSYKEYKVTIIDSLPVMKDIVIAPESNKILVGVNSEFSIKVSLGTVKSYDNFKDAGAYKTRLHAGVYSKDSLLFDQVCQIPVNQLLEKNKGEYSFSFYSPGRKGRFKIIIALETSALGTWSTQKVIGLTVK